MMREILFRKYYYPEDIEVVGNIFDNPGCGGDNDD